MLQRKTCGVFLSHVEEGEEDKTTYYTRDVHTFLRRSMRYAETTCSACVGLCTCTWVLKVENVRESRIPTKETSAKTKRRQN